MYGPERLVLAKEGFYFVSQEICRLCPYITNSSFYLMGKRTRYKTRGKYNKVDQGKMSQGKIEAQNKST